MVVCEKFPVSLCNLIGLHYRLRIWLNMPMLALLFLSSGFLCIVEPVITYAETVMPSQQAIDLADQAFSEGRAGNDARARFLWDRARKADPSVPQVPSSWFKHNKAQRFIPSLKERPLLRKELIILIAMLPYQQAQKQLQNYLDRFPGDTEIRELSLAMAALDKNHPEITRQSQSFKLPETGDSSTVSMPGGYFYELKLIMAATMMAGIFICIWWHVFKKGKQL